MLVLLRYRERINIKNEFIVLTRIPTKKTPASILVDDCCFKHLIYRRKRNSLE